MIIPRRLIEPYPDLVKSDSRNKSCRGYQLKDKEREMVSLSAKLLSGQAGLISSQAGLV